MSAGGSHPAIGGGRYAGETGACPLPDVERRCGVLGCHQDGDILHTAGRLGPWADAAPGHVRIGALGVLLDHALGEALYRVRGEGRWSLTTELGIDVLVAPPWPGGEVHVVTAAPHGDTSGGYCRGSLHAEDGRLLVEAATRVQYVPARPDPSLGSVGAPGAGAVGSDAGGVAGSLVEHLGCAVRHDGEAVEVRLDATPRWANPYGALHGGVWTALAEIAATEVLAGAPRPLSPARLAVSFVRGAHPGPVTTRARARHVGRSFAHVEVSGTDSAGRECVVATLTARARGSEGSG